MAGAGQECRLSVVEIGRDPIKEPKVPTSSAIVGSKYRRFSDLYT